MGPTLDLQLTTRVGADYLEEPFFYYVGDTQTPDNFAGCSLVGGIYLNGSLRIDLGAATGYAQLSQPNRIDIRVPLAAIAGIGPGIYTVALGLVAVNGETEDILNYSLKVVPP